MGRCTILLDSEFSTTGVVAPDPPDDTVTGFAHTVAPNLTYYVEGVFIVRSASSTIGARTGIAWPTGLTAQIAAMYGRGQANQNAVERAWGADDMADPRIYMPESIVSVSWPILMRAWFRTGAGASGDFQITLAPESVGTSVSLRAGSFFHVYSQYDGQQ